MDFTVVSCLCLIFAVMSPALIDFVARYRRHRKWTGRESLNSSRIYSTFYHKRGLDPSVVVPVWKELVYALDLKEGALRPFDELRQLSFYYAPFDSMTNRVNLVLRSYMAPDADVSCDFETIDDIIVFICEHWRYRLG